MTTPVGTRLDAPEWRVEGHEKVTGRAAYVADLRRPGMLHVAFARSPFAHARIARIDVAAARAAAGVHAVLTGVDIRPARLGRRLQDWPLLAWDTVRFVGDPVAAVAAETLADAEAAAAAIEVEYDELAAIFDPLAALEPGAPVLHPDAGAYRYLGGTRPTTEHPNIQGHVHHEHGDVDAAFAAAAHVFEHSFEVARNFHGHLEPHASLVWMDGERFHIASTNKSPFRLRDHLEGSLDIPPDQLVIDAGYIGGDFGGKGFSADDYILTILARRTGRPVRSVPRFGDDLRATNTRHAAHIRMRTGLDADGRILVHETHTVFDGGAYSAAKGNVGLVPGGSLHTLPGYAVPHARLDVTTVYTNQVPGGHARAPGQPQNSFAGESHVDLMARALGIDPLEFRRRSAIRAGETDVMGRTWETSSMAEVIETLAGATGWNEPVAPGRGRGMAIGARSSPSGGRDATVVVRVTEHANVEVLTAVPDQGGGAHTMIQRVVAETLELPLEQVVVRRGTTAEAPVDLGVGGSRVTPVVGGAAAAGARALVEGLAADHPGLSLEDQLAAAATGDVSVVTTFEHPAGMYTPYAFAVEVEIDPDTGQVTVVEGTFVADVGTVINPLALRGQLVGGLVAGLGQALMEDVRIDDGQIVTANLGDYKLPTMADVPPLRVVLVTNHDGGGPFGAKSAGELGNVPVAPAIANAIHDATGLRIRSLPITAEKVHRAGMDEHPPESEAATPRPPPP
jgi:CO/xanthine dehydrogenase Mo-binding subunit